MIYENCRRLLSACVKTGLIKTVPKNAKSQLSDGSIIDLPEGYLIFAECGNDTGGFVQSLEDAASDLQYDRAGQKFIQMKLKEAGITVDLINEKEMYRSWEAARKLMEEMFSDQAETAGHAVG